MEASKPNILYIFTDQQSADALSCAGNPNLKTPAMDRLAERGVRFESAYTAFPLCVPARMAMFTGRMPHELGIFANVHPVEDTCPNPMLGRLLQEAGYLTNYVGKWHLTVPEKRYGEHGFEKVICGGGYGDSDAKKAEEAAAFLKKTPQEPFFLTVSFNNPHDCCELARGEPLRMEDLPPFPPDEELPPPPESFAESPETPQVMRRFQKQHPRIGCALEWNERQVRRFRWGYNRLVEMVDREIGKVLDALEEAGLEDNTLIIFSSDHGDGQGTHRWNQKWSLYESSVRVPMIAVPPGGERNEKVEKRPVSASLDLFPTLCDYARITPPENLCGKSLKPVLEGRGEIPDRKYVAAETSLGTWAELKQDQWPKGRMIRTEKYKYILFDSGDNREQLFDLENDPGELVNLAGEPSCEKILNQHRSHLRQWCELTDDTFKPHIS